MNEKLSSILTDLKITPEFLQTYKLEKNVEPPLEQLEVVDIDKEGRPFILHQKSARPWREMVRAAKKDRVELFPFSGFRSYIYQKSLIEKKLEKGKTLEVILTETAVPGYSEHHTGLAVDIWTDENFRLTESFSDTSAFGWLQKFAGDFRFRLSYPMNNSKGIVFEPWHWYYFDL